MSLDRRPHPEIRSGSNRLVITDRPKVVLVSAPHSPFAVTLVRSHSGTKLPFASVHVRVADNPSATTPELAVGIPIPRPCRYLPMENLSAVLPLPKRSHAMPARGVMSL